MGDVITLVPNRNYTMSIDSSRSGFYCAWSVNGEVIWQYEADNIADVKVFFESMIGRVNDTGTPLQGA